MMIRSSMLSAAVLASAAFLPAAGLAAPAPVPACVAAQLDAPDASGVALAVRDGRPVVSEARGTGITADTPFNIGSLNKMFTAVAIGQLVDAGKVRFDDPLGRHLEDLPPALARVTLDQLLTHTSGAGNYFVPQNRAAIEAAASASDLLPLITDRPLEFEPGSKVAYSNSGFVLLGAVIEAVSGEPYDRYVARHVFEPAGMTATAMRAGPAAATAMTRMDPRTGSSGGQLRPSPFAGMRASPAGGAFSTAGDLARFAAAFQADRLTSAATRRALTTRRPAPTAAAAAGGQGGYGYGFTVSGEGADLRFGHGGGSAGVNAELAVFPQRGLVVVVLTNRDPPSATMIERALEAALLSGTCDAKA